MRCKRGMAFEIVAVLFFIHRKFKSTLQMSGACVVKSVYILNSGFIFSTCCFIVFSKRDAFFAPPCKCTKLSFLLGSAVTFRAEYSQQHWPVSNIHHSSLFLLKTLKKNDWRNKDKKEEQDFESCNFPAAWQTAVDGRLRCQNKTVLLDLKAPPCWHAWNMLNPAWWHICIVWTRRTECRYIRNMDIRAEEGRDFPWHAKHWFSLRLLTLKYGAHSLHHTSTYWFPAFRQPGWCVTNHCLVSLQGLSDAPASLRNRTVTGINRLHAVMFDQ